MRTLFFVTFVLPFALGAQNQQLGLAVAPPHQIESDLRQALIGDWTGLLEYRDYSEPATSTKRVQLPTWLSISASGHALTEHFIYDDGPAKVVYETLALVFDVAASSYQITSDSNRTESYRVEGYSALHAGLGSLIITGPTIDNNRPAETRIVLTVRRNLLTWTEENRAVATEPYIFRHSYTFTRAQAPKVMQQH
jgi:hypothetical protein